MLQFSAPITTTIIANYSLNIIHRNSAHTRLHEKTLHLAPFRLLCWWLSLAIIPWKRETLHDFLGNHACTNI